MNKTKKKRVRKKTFLSKILERFLLRQKMKAADIANSRLLSKSTLSNIFSGQRLPSDELLYAIGKGMRLTTNEIAKLLLYLAQDRTTGSAKELWIDILKSLESPDNRGFHAANVGSQAQTGSFIPIYETVWPGLKPNEVQGNQIGIFPYWEEKAKNGAFGLLVLDDSMDGPGSFLKENGLAVFESVRDEVVSFGGVFCVHLPGEEKCKIRRVFKEENGEIKIQPDNSRKKPVFLSFNSETKIFFGILAGFWKFPG